MKLENNILSNYLGDVADILDTLLDERNRLNRIIDIIWKTYTDGGTIYIIGNGGSASNAQHFAQGFCSVFIPAKALVDNVAITMSIANDDGYAAIFENQLRVFAKKVDTLIALSASGNSRNIIRAIDVARAKCGHVIGMTGFDGGKLWDMTDECIVVPSSDYGIIEDIHSMLGHIIPRMVREKITNGSR